MLTIAGGIVLAVAILFGIRILVNAAMLAFAGVHHLLTTSRRSAR